MKIKVQFNLIPFSNIVELCRLIDWRYRLLNWNICGFQFVGLSSSTNRTVIDFDLNSFTLFQFLKLQFFFQFNFKTRSKGWSLTIFLIGRKIKSRSVKKTSARSTNETVSTCISRVGRYYPSLTITSFSYISRFPKYAVKSIFATDSLIDLYFKHKISQYLRWNCAWKVKKEKNNTPHVKSTWVYGKNRISPIEFEQ